MHVTERVTTNSVFLKTFFHQLHPQSLLNFFFLNSAPMNFFWPCHTACGILVPQPGTEPEPSAVKAWSPNHWTVREFLQ